MVRYRKKVALYEVINKAGLNSDVDDQPVQDEQGSNFENVKWPKKPRIVQFNVGRVEFSMPYQLAIAIVLCFLLAALVLFRLGQNSGRAEGVESDASVTSSAQNTEARSDLPVKRVERKERMASTSEAGESSGSNRIVIQTWQSRSQLEPVKKYFDQAGIETEIRKIGNTYYLVTKDKYENPEKKGTDGYKAKERIIELGANYKSPAGYGSFGLKPFHDAYGMKFDD
jgi:hypothetical protein